MAENCPRTKLTMAYDKRATTIPITAYRMVSLAAAVLVLFPPEKIYLKPPTISMMTATIPIANKRVFTMVFMLSTKLVGC